MVAGIAFSVENRQFDPAIVRVEPNAPDYGGYFCGEIIELENFRFRLPNSLVTWFDRRADAAGVNVLIDSILDTIRNRVGLIEILF